MKKNWIITVAAVSAISTFSLAQATGGAATGGNAGGVSGPMPGMSSGVDTDGTGGTAATTGGGATMGGGQTATGGSAQTATELQTDAAQIQAGSDTTTQQRFPRPGSGVGLPVGSDMQGTGQAVGGPASGGATVDINRDAQPAALRGEGLNRAEHGLTTATEASGRQVPANPNLNLPAGSDMQGTGRAGQVTAQPGTGRIDTSGTEGSINVGQRDTTISEPAPGNEVQPAPGAPSANVITAPGGAFQGADPTAGDATVTGNFGNVGDANVAADTAQPAAGSVGATTQVGTNGMQAVVEEDATTERQVGVGQVSPDFGDANVTVQEGTGVQGSINVDQATRDLSLPASQVPRAQGGLSDMPPLATPPADQTAPRVIAPPVTSSAPQVNVPPPVIVDPAAQPAGAQIQPLPTLPRPELSTQPEPLPER